MDTYDPLDTPDPDDWLELDEGERLELVLDHHRQARVELPNEQVHAVFHVIIENQAAMGDEVPTRATLERLMGEGLDRHDAIHAAGSVLANHVHKIMSAGDAAGDMNEEYFKELEDLTAEAWLREFG